MHRTAALAYRDTDGRDLRLDLLRGLAVVAMVVDHVAGPSELRMFTGGNRFFTSAAEAFVLISGLVTGQVYGRIAERLGLASAQLRLLRRAGELYLLTLCLTLVALMINQPAFASDDGAALQTPLEMLWSVVTLHRTTYLVDVQLLYTLLLLVAPLALLLMQEGRTWIVVVGSALLWGSHQLFVRSTDLPWPIPGNNVFHFDAWQVLFFTGMVLGFHRRRLQDQLSRLRHWPLLFASGSAFAALVVVFGRLFAPLHSGLAAASPDEHQLALTLQETVFSKADVQIGRLVASLIVFGFLFLLATKLWIPIRRSVGWLLLPLGQNALYAYTAHTVLALGFPLIALRSGFSVPETSSLNAAVQVGAVALILIAIRLRFLFPSASKFGWYRFAAVPVSAAMAVLSTFTFNAIPATNAVASAATTGVSPDEATRLAKVFGTPVTRLPLLPAPEATPPPVWAQVDARPAGIAQSIQMRVQGKFREVSFYSAALDRELSYYVYLPPGSDAHARRYPVLYMLHGGGGSKDEWLVYGVIDEVDRMIREAQIGSMIVVLPQGDTGYWVNHANDGARWGDYVRQDVIASVDATLPTVADRAHRAIGGLSMGGAGALQLAFNYPDLFGVVGAHSPSLHVDDGTFPILGVGADFETREPIQLAARAQGIENLEIWIDAGDQDPWLGRDQLLHQALLDRSIPHVWNVLPGGHEGPYWQENLKRYLRWYDASLNSRST